MKNSNFGWALFSITLFVIGAIAAIIYIQASTTRQYSCDTCPSLVQEKLGFTSVNVTSPTSLRANVVDTGSSSIAIYYYFINDTRGDSYASQTSSSPWLSPGGPETLDLSLKGTLTGQPFQLQSGQVYTVSLLTSRNNLFTHSFTA